MKEKGLDVIRVVDRSLRTATPKTILTFVLSSSLNLERRSLFGLSVSHFCADRRPVGFLASAC